MHRTNYIDLRYVERGGYIPAHDPSYTHDSMDKAVTEAKFDLDHSDVDRMAIYKIVAVVTKDGVTDV